MRSGLNSCSWKDLVVIGLTVICFNGKLLEPVSASSDLSERAVRLASMLSSNYTNEEQVQNAIDNDQPVPVLNIASFRPIHIISLEENMTFFIEQSFEGMYFQNIGVLGEDNEGLIYIKLFALNESITLPYSPSPADLSRLKNLTLDDLIGFEDRCDGTNYELEHGLFLGKWPSCETFPPEIITYIPFVTTCEKSAAHNPVGIDFPEVVSQAPIVMTPKERYPLVYYSGGKVREYKNFCKKVKG